jgi:hypothetical protein
MSKPSITLNNQRGFVIVVVLAFHSVVTYLASLPDKTLPSTILRISGNHFPSSITNAYVIRDGE